MKRAILLLLCIAIIAPLRVVAQEPTPKQVDICVYGGTSLGVIAAYAAKKQGKSVLLIEPTNHIGGMTSGGLGQTDILSPCWRLLQGFGDVGFRTTHSLKGL